MDGHVDNCLLLLAVYFHKTRFIKIEKLQNYKNKTRNVNAVKVVY